MEDFLKKLYNNNIQLSLLLLEAKDIADENDNQELSNYIEREINGYKVGDQLPDYRKIKGELVCDIQDVYGNLRYKEFQLDFSKLSEILQFDLDDSLIPDGISFIETSLNGLTGQTALKPIPKQITKMLDEIFHKNNQSLHIIASYHKVPTATLNYVLTKVRQNLIQSFQKLNKRLLKSKSEIQVKQDIIPNDFGLKKIKVFVSYAWESEEHNSKVISFVEFLRKNGFDASMDRKKSQESIAINFNQMMIDGIQNSDKVIIILSKIYKEKVDKFEGSVWQELNLAIEEMKTKKNKYIFVFFGYDDRKSITPTAISGTEILDLKKDQDESSFNSLFAKIKEENIIEFSDVSEEVIQVKKMEIKPFKL